MPAGKHALNLRLRRWGAAVGCLVLLAFAALLVAQLVKGRPWKTTFVIPLSTINHDEGSTYRAGGTGFETLLQRTHRKVTVLENGMPLALRASSSQEVRNGGRGSYFFSADGIWLTASDGSDPRTNGRAYAAVFPVLLPAITPLLVVLLVAAAGTFAWWGVWGRWPWVMWRSIARGPAPPPTRDHTRNWSLDVLRAVAMGLVMMHHGETSPPGASPFLHWITATLERGGWIGVDLFFVLSGYLVSGLLWSEWERTGALNIGRFLCRRGFKLYPAFWVMISVSLLAASMGLPPNVHINGIIGEFLFLQNYVGILWGHTWSLAVEEHFYLLLALLFASLAGSSRLRRRARLRRVVIPGLFVAVAIACLALRLLRYRFMGESAYGHYYVTHARIDALMFGVLLRCWRVYWPEAWQQWMHRGRWFWVPVACAMWAPAFVLERFRDWWLITVGFTFNYLAAGCMLLSSGVWERWSWLKNATRPLQACGRHSYSIYLWHMPIYAWVKFALPENLPGLGELGRWWVFTLLYLTASLLVGVSMGKMIEQPLLRLRDRWFPSRSQYDADPPVPTQANVTTRPQFAG